MKLQTVTSSLDALFQSFQKLAWQNTTSRAVVSETSTCACIKNSLFYIIFSHSDCVSGCKTMSRHIISIFQRCGRSIFTARPTFIDRVAKTRNVFCLVDPHTPGFFFRKSVCQPGKWARSTSTLQPKPRIQRAQPRKPSLVTCEVLCSSSPDVNSSPWSSGS
jgi:hypothetical protein